MQENRQFRLSPIVQWKRIPFREIRAAFKIVAASLAARGAFKIVAASLEAKS